MNGTSPIQKNTVGSFLLAETISQPVSGIATIIFAKLAGFGVTSFLFTLCKPKLLQVRWVKWTYEHCLVWRDKAHELVKPYMRYVRSYIKLITPRTSKQNVVGKLRTQVHKMRQ